MEPFAAAMEGVRRFDLDGRQGHFEREREIAFAMFVVNGQLFVRLGTIWIGDRGQFAPDRQRGIAPKGHWSWDVSATHRSSGNGAVDGTLLATSGARPEVARVIGAYPRSGMSKLQCPEGAAHE